jgi:hypothetical protein
VFGVGDGVLNKFVRDKIICRNKARDKREAAAIERKKKSLKALAWQVKKIREEMSKKKSRFNYTIAKLKPLVQWKTNKDEKMPKKKADLLKRYKETKDRASPNVLPYNSEADLEYEEGDDSESDVEAEEFDNAESGLVFSNDEDIFDLEDDDDADEAKWVRSPKEGRKSLWSWKMCHSLGRSRKSCAVDGLDVHAVL